jgi:hypothetical protein
VISKLGLAACSILTLGCVSRRIGVPWEGCTGGGILGPADDGSTSSLKSTESSILLLIGLCADPIGWRRLCVTVCSFCGGAGGWSTTGAGALSPSGPSGPRESSRASSRTGVCPARRGVRGCRAVGDLTACEADEVSRDAGAFGFTEASIHTY